MRRAAILLCLALSLLLAGCGFQLRGASGIPEAIQPLALKCAPPVPDRICRAVKDQLTLGKVNLVSTSEAATVLRLTNFRQERRANAVTERAATAEFTLRNSIELEVIAADQTPLIATERVNTSETFDYDETNVLAKQREEEALQQVLAQRLAQQVLFRLTPLTRTRLDAFEAPQ